MLIVWLLIPLLARASQDELCYRVKWDSGASFQLLRPVSKFPSEHAVVQRGVCGGANAGDPIPNIGRWSTSGSTDRNSASCLECCQCTTSFSSSCRGKGQVYGGSLFYAYNFPKSSSSNTGYEAAETHILFFVQDTSNQLWLAIVLDAANNADGGKLRLAINSTGVGGYGTKIQLRDDYVADRASCASITSDCYAWDTVSGRGTFSWKWATCCTDGMVLGPLPSTGFSMELKYNGIEGLNQFKLGDYRNEPTTVLTSYHSTIRPPPMLRSTCTME